MVYQAVAICGSLKIATFHIFMHTIALAQLIVSVLSYTLYPNLPTRCHYIFPPLFHLLYSSTAYIYQ